MDHAIDLSQTPALLIHASGALTFCGAGEAMPALWDDDLAVLAVAA